MLVLSIKKGESIIIAGNIKVTLLETGATSRLGFIAPKEVSILREKLLLKPRPDIRPH